jgi:hypothetical protein
MAPARGKTQDPVAAHPHSDPVDQPGEVGGAIRFAGEVDLCRIVIIGGEDR